MSPILQIHCSPAILGRGDAYLMPSHDTILLKRALPMLARITENAGEKPRFNCQSESDQ